MKLTKKDKRTYLEVVIDEQLTDLVSKATTLEEITDVVELYEKRQKIGDKPKISPDTIAIIAGNLLGIGLILSYEKLNVITTKALGFVLRGRV